MKSETPSQRRSGLNRARLLAVIHTGTIFLILFATTRCQVLAAGPYDEGINGDLSGDRLSPTAFGALGTGANTLRATSQAGDLEYVTFTVPSGVTLASLVLSEYSAANDTAFLAIQSGTTFTVPPETANANISSLLGWTHFGSGGVAGAALVGTDILDDLGAGSGAIGFAPPLPAGDYTLWIQQAQASPTTYTFQFGAVPELEHTGWAAAAMLVAGAALWKRHRRLNGR